MARARLRYVITDAETGAVLEGAKVYVYQPGTTTAPFGTMYSAESGGSVKTNPLASDARGEVLAWFDTAQVVDLLVTDGGTAVVPGGTHRTFSSFTLASVPVQPTPSSSVAEVPGQQQGLTVENHSTELRTFGVQGDNGEGHGVMDYFSIENNNPGPVDLNFRNIVANIGMIDPAYQFYGAVPFNFNSPLGSTGQYLRAWKPGDSNVQPFVFAVSVNGSVTLNVGGVSSTALIIAVAGDAQPRFRFDEFGKMYWGPGGSTAVDTTLERSAANVLALGADDALKTGTAAHASLPSPAGYAAGAQFYCTTDKKPVWSDGSAHWVDAAGANHT